MPPRPATVPGITNQDVINAFFAVDRTLLPRAFADWVAELIGPGGGRRSLIYTGPRLEDALPEDGARVAAALSWRTLSGRGVWLKGLDEASAGVTAGHLDALVAQARAAGLSHLIVKLGHETRPVNDHAVLRALGDRLRAEGGLLWGYHLVAAHRADGGPVSVEAQAARAAEWVRATGVQGLAIWVSDGGDGGWAEEWVPDATRRADRAARYAAALRTGLGARFPLGLCAPALPAQHPGVPWAELAAEANAFMPRVLGDDAPLPDEAGAAVAAWAALGGDRPVLPVLRAYDDGFSEDDLHALEAAAATAAPAGRSFFRWGTAAQAGLWGAVGGRPRGVVYRDGAALKLDGRPFEFIGVNLRELIHYGNPDVARLAQEAHIQGQLDAARRLGARVARVFLPHVSYDPARPEALDRARAYLAGRGVPVPDDAATLLREEVAARLAHTLDLACGPRDALRPDAVRLLVALTDYNSHSGFFPPADRDRFRDGFLEDPAWYTDGWQGEYWALAAHVIPRFRGDPRVFAWEVGNELKLPAGPARFIAFVRAAARRIKQLDPTHLVGPGVISAWHCNFDDAQAAEFYAIPHLDFVTVHVAGDDFPRLLDVFPGGHDDAVEGRRRGYISHDAAIARQTRRPLIIEEAGYPRDRRVNLGALLEFARSEGAVGFMPWGFSGVGGDIGVGDNHWGLDDYHPSEGGQFHAVAADLRAWADEHRRAIVA